MRGTDNRIPLLAALFVGLLFAAMPGTAQAQTSIASLFGAGGATAAAATNCGGMTGVQLCQCQLSNASVQRAQSKTVSLLKIYGNASNPAMRLVYCFNTVANIIIAIGNATAGGPGNLISTLFWLIVLPILNILVNSVCQAVVGSIESAINMLKNLVCIPIPHFGLSLNFGFKGGSCGGINLFNILGVSVPRTVGQSAWQYGGYTPMGASP